MCWSAATAASAAAASGSTKLLRSGIFVFARRLACARRPSSLSRPCRALTRAQMSCAEVSSLGGLARPHRLKSMDKRCPEVFCEYVK